MLFSVDTSPHCVSCTIQCEETGFHFLSARLFEEAVYGQTESDFDASCLINLFIILLSLVFSYLTSEESVCCKTFCENQEFLFLIYDLIQKHDLYTVFITLQ